MKDQPYETAVTQRVRRLYRYQRFVPGRLTKLLADGQIHFSPPSAFNDLWDCKPWYKVPTDERELNKLFDYFERVHTEHHPEVSADERARRRVELKENPRLFVELMRELSTEMWVAMDLQYRICCFAAKPDCQLMWAHYAESHTGICLEFDVWQEDLCSAIKVEYRETYPTYGPHDPNDISVLYTKSDAWKYEQEYRLVAGEEGQPFSPGLQTQNGLFTLPPNTIKSITIGARASPERRETIREMVTKSGAGILVRQAEPAEGRYELVITPPFG